ncbi:hypothetical protein [Parendozoicomonas haliclonae]|uniref:Uncharacterized protein n=1 Tax=Parendozoicomonas haliclonae TaxID=1960125 RepID=A0A1X7AS41_9GAMM|nr:hypothetical protein [Parendozoicomonas haliclonae]SMA50962.1 hypothetical protein EHSB41UT_04783 [Parendozoicomonas haliclonae]
MTLSVAWHSKEGIYFASDSRVSRGGKYSDYGVKVIPVQIRIFNPGKDDTSPSIAFEKTYGMCFAGDFAGSAIIQNFFSVTLQRLQYVPSFSTISFESICRVVNNLYREVSIKLQEEIDNECIDFFFSGFCPLNKKIMLAKFYIDYGNNVDQYEPQYEVIDYESDPEPIYYIGSGESAYAIHLDINKEKPISTRPMYALKTLIDSKSSNSVGGNIQAGNFSSSHEFYMLGIYDKSINQQGHIESVHYYYSGLDMNSDLFETCTSGLMVIGNYIDLSQ